MTHIIRPATVTLIGKLLHPLTASNLITVPELNEIKSQLKHLSEHGTAMPTVIPKMIDQNEAAEMLGISLANFKRLERDNYFPFQRKLVGTSVRYRNTDIIKYMLSNDNDKTIGDPDEAI